MRLLPLLLALILPSVASAAEVSEIRRDAEALVQQGKTVKAATLLGKELATAQKKGDLVRQQQIHDALRQTLGSLDQSEAADAKGGMRECSFTVMKLLDAKRARTCLSAHHLARHLLFCCVRYGDERYLKQAAALTTSFAKGKHRGVHATAMTLLAEGIVLARAGKHNKSYPLLEETLELCIANGWNLATVHAAIEMQATNKALSRTRVSVSLNDKVIASLEKMSDRHAAQAYRAAWTSRLGEMSPAIDATIRKLDGGPGQGGGAGGAGGAGGSGGANESAVGRVLKKYSAKKSLVSVRLTRGEFQIRHQFSKFRTDHALAKGVTHQNDGGITLAFWGVGLQLAMVDPIGNRGQPGDGSAPTPWMFFDPLSQGEIWSFNKRGEVSIR